MNILQTSFYLLLLCASTTFAMQTKNYVSVEDFLNKIGTPPPQDNAQWINVINTNFQDNEQLKFNFSSYAEQLYYKRPRTKFFKITISKQELLQLNFDKINMINNIQKEYCFSKEKLLLFNDLPINLANNLKNYFYVKTYDPRAMDTDYRMKFYYKKKLSLTSIGKAALNSCKQLLPSVIPTLLYHHLYVESLENLWAKIQSPSLLEENKKQELTNKLIDTLQASFTPGSELLEKTTIIPVPFEWVLPYDKSTEYTLNKTYILAISAIIFNIPLLHSWYHLPPKYYRVHSEADFHYALHFMLFISCNILIFIAHCASVEFTSLNCQTITHELSKLIFSHGIPIGLAGIVVAVSLCGIIKEIISSCIKKTKIIDFPKNKFKDKTIQEVISHYLKKPNIEIL